MSQLDKNIKEHYKNKYCPKHIAENLLKKYPCPNGDCTIWYKIICVAALLLVLFLGYTSLTYLKAHCTTTQMITIHEQAIDMPVHPQQIQSLKKDLPKLTFLPEKLPKELDQKFTVMGAGYCKIKGKAVARLNVVDKKSGKIYTLYISPKKGPASYPVNSTMKNNTIRRWSQNKLSFTLIS